MIINLLFDIQQSQRLLFSIVCLTLASCGGGSTGSSGSLAVSPVTSNVPAGLTQQFAVTGGSSVTWEVNGNAGGNATVGTISSSGLYAAPNQPPTAEPITITATSDGMTATATLNVTYSDASIQGTFMAGFTEYGASSDASLLGYFIFDGNGDISGTVDANTTSAVYTTISITGHYSVNPDGSGTLSINAGAVGDFNLDLTLAAGGNFAVTGATGGEIVSNIWAPQPNSAGATALSPATYILDYSGFISNAANVQYTGAVTATGTGQLTVQELDQNTSGTTNLETGLSGSYTLNSDGRGTFYFSDAQGTHHFVMYAEPGGSYQIMSLDPGTPLTGSLDLQTSTILPTSGYGLVSAGSYNSLGKPDGFLAQVDLTNQNYIGSENDNGVITSISGSGSVQAPDQYGRGQLTIPTGSGLRTFVYYVESSSAADLIEADTSGNLSGAIFSAPENVSFESGHYVLVGSYLDSGSQALNSHIGILNFSNATQVSGMETINSGGIVSSETVSGGISFGAAGGSLTLNLSNGDTQHFMVLGLADGFFALLGEDSTNIGTSALIVQYTPAP